MAKIKILYIFVFSIFLNLNNIEGQDRKFVNEFLNLGVGARSLAMFGAVSANTNDITAGYWNPAGLLNVNVPFQVSAMHSEWFAGIAKYDYLAFGKQLGKENKSFGSISLLRFGIDNIPNTIGLITPDGNIDYDNISEFSSADYALIISYARKAFGNISVGGSTKIIYRQIGKFANAWGFGFDFGAQFKLSKFTVGIMGRDLTSTFNAWSFSFTDEEKDILIKTGNEIPKSSIEYALPKIIAGIAYEGGMGADKKGLSYLIELDLNFSTDGQRHALLSSDFINISPAVGIELGLKQKVFFRAGVGNLQRVLNDITLTQNSYEFQPNIGIGLKLGRLHLDYALTNVGETASVLYSHIFSLSLDLAKKKRYTLGAN